MRAFLTMAVVMCGFAGASVMAQGIAPSDPPPGATPPEPPREVLRPDARDVLRDAKAAAGKLKTLSYKAKASVVGAGAFPTVNAEVVLERLRQDGSALGARLLIRGDVESPEGRKKFAASYDGATVRIIDHDAKKVIEARGDDAIRALDEFLATPRGAPVKLAPYMQEDAFDRELEAEVVASAGREDVEGTACEVVRAEGLGGALSERISLGLGDRLARRVEISASVGHAGGGPVTLTVRDLIRNPSLDRDTFAITIPSGFKVVEWNRPDDGGVAAEPARGSPVKVGDLAPDWALRDADGQEVALSGLRGSVVVLDFWATWCGPCKKAMPLVQKLHTTFGDGGVRVLGLSVWERGGDPARYMSEHGYTYGLLVKGDEVATRYGIRAIPTFFVIDADGRVVYRATGMSQGEESKIVRVIQKALDDRPK